MNFENVDHMLVHFAQKLKVQFILILLEESQALSALDRSGEMPFASFGRNEQKIHWLAILNRNFT